MNKSLKNKSFLLISDIHPKLQKKWGDCKEITIDGVSYPFPGLHSDKEEYRSPMIDNGLEIWYEFESRALIEGDVELAVYILLAWKP